MLSFVFDASLVTGRVEEVFLLLPLRQRFLLNLAMDEGFCPVDIAIQQGHDDIVSIFVQHDQIDINLA